MEPATYGFIGTIVGAIVGASASIATTFINSWNSTRMRTKADELLRVERGRNFQRDTLLKIQEALQDSMNNIGGNEPLRCRCLSRNWGLAEVTSAEAELNLRVLTVNRELSLLTERIFNDELRNHINAFRTQLSDCLFTNSEKEGDYQLKQAVDKFNPLMENIGKVLTRPSRQGSPGVGASPK